MLRETILVFAALLALVHATQVNKCGSGGYTRGNRDSSEDTRDFRRDHPRVLADPRPRAKVYAVFTPARSKFLGRSEPDSLCVHLCNISEGYYRLLLINV